MNALSFLLWLTLQRVRTDWRLTLASFVGVLLAVTLISVAAIHSNTLAEAGLRFRMNPEEVKNNLGIEIGVPARPMNVGDYRQLDAEVRAAIDEHIGPLATSSHRLLNTEAMRFRFEDAEQNAIGVATMHAWEDLGEHVLLLEGRWPSATPEEPGTVEVAIANDAFTPLNRFFGWEVGSRLRLVYPQQEPDTELTVRIVGVFDIADLGDPFWFFGEVPELRLGDFGQEYHVHFYTEPDAFLEQVVPSFPRVLANYIWTVGLDIGSLTPATAHQASLDVEALEAEVEAALPRAVAVSPLIPAVTRFERDLSFSRVPLFLFISFVIGAILYYLSLLLWLMTRSRGAEAALVRSRGASRGAVGAFLGLGEGIFVALPAVAIGPFLGLVIASFIPVGNPELEAFSAGLSPSVFLYAGLVGLLAVIVFWAAGFTVAGRGIIDLLRERYRQGGQPALYRYAVDLGVLAMVGLLWWRIQGRGGFITRRLLGSGVEADLTLLLGPAIGMLALGLVLLRVYPYLLRLLARAAALMPGAALVYGVQRMARDPMPYAALAVLLMFSTSLGIFAAAFGPTLTQSTVDQARYRVGAEVIVPTPWVALRLQGYDQAAALSAGLESVGAVAPVTGGTLTQVTTPVQGGAVTILASDPPELAKVAWFRPDFSAAPLSHLMTWIDQTPFPEVGIPLPDDTEGIGVWVRPNFPLPEFNVWARYRDTQGLYENVLLGKISTPDWTYVEQALPERAHLVGPYTLTALYVTGPEYLFVGFGSLYFDDVVAISPTGEQTLVEDFEEQGPWVPMPNLDFSPDSVLVKPEAARSGELGMLFTWVNPLGDIQRGMFIPPVPMPIPAIGSADFTPGQVLTGQFLAQAVPLWVIANAQHFPTLGLTVGPFLIVDMEALDLYQRSLPSARALAPTEFWVSVSDGFTVEDTLAELREVVPVDAGILDGTEESREALRDPMAGGPWRGLGLLGLGTLIGTAVLGFVLYSLLMLRQSQAELGMLQTLGFTGRQMGMVLGVAGGLVALAGVAVGTGAGLWLGQWILSFLNVTVSGRAIRPPAVLVQESWMTLLTYGGVVLAAIVATALAIAVAHRLNLARVLRQEE